MDPNDNAKYLNSSETELLFDKGAVLTMSVTRAAAGQGKTPLIVAEGYMDVIALVQAGFGAAVAPLGRPSRKASFAKMLWRISPTHHHAGW